ncbi:MAG: YciI family protein [Xanthomonadaceae bacterium]|nr:YciI family protein [Xanthomonadaceae bacterium]MDE1962675.1 YciI family protein [Xanthomonadaceae bacterium]
MRCMVMVRATAQSEDGAMPDPAILDAMGRFNEALVQAGVMLAGEGLRPSRDGKRVRFADGGRQVVDGPFAETRELIAGFWLWQVRSMDEALEWARRCPAPFVGECEIEIRPLYEEADFADIMSPELRESEALLRAQLEERSR